MLEEKLINMLREVDINTIQENYDAVKQDEVKHLEVKHLAVKHLEVKHLAEIKHAYDNISLM